MKTWNAVLGAAAALVLAAASAAAEQAVIARDADLRSGAGFGKRVVGRLPADQGVELLEERIGWTRVRAGDQVGWVRAHLVGRPAQGAPMPAPAILSEAAATAWSPSPAMPGAEARLPPGPEPEADGWAVATTVAADPREQVEGAYAADVSSYESPSAAALPSAPSRTLYLRPQPTFDTGLSGRVPQGESFEVLARDYDWTQIRATSGAIGWVRTEALPVGLSAGLALAPADAVLASFR